MSAPRTLLITGAAKGIGLAVAEAFDAPGNHLVLVDLDPAGLHQALASRNWQAEVETQACDIASLPQVQGLFDDLSRRLAQVDVLVNSAGICTENEPEDLDNWRRVIDVNLHGTFQVTSLCLPLLADGGRIVNMASILGRAGKVRNTAYCASKHGIIGLTKALALDLAPRRITVNAILPAWIDTPMLRGELAVQARIAGISEREILRNARKKLPLRRFIAASEVAGMVQYLASEQAAGLTAQSLMLDGGVGLGM
ncbi:SDR family NAD(P)-dependent oxidoreductase [Pseudomonas sp. K1(2024)]|uniref:SDR family NAD(P)-dependent oxidoreductase n=1 Tax=Pseudomonas boreofloridensis TaxID=3064348 RepID=A0ABV4Z5M2_9PSED|nr:SDR family NAD(P)-dependent oxidoreductase [Pseudomonas sp. K13]MDO7903548.1 SDR family NAD(P)-dependent oxidoreductase [Pseudomonas sp. K13]